MAVFFLPYSLVSELNGPIISSWTEMCDERTSPSLVGSLLSFAAALLCECSLSLSACVCMMMMVQPQSIVTGGKEIGRKKKQGRN